MQFLSSTCYIFEHLFGYIAPAQVLPTSMCMWILAIILTSVCDYANYEAYLHHPIKTYLEGCFMTLALARYVTELSICGKSGPWGVYTIIYIYTTWLLHLSCHCTGCVISCPLPVLCEDNSRIVFLHAFLGLCCWASFRYSPILVYTVCQLCFNIVCCLHCTLGN